MHDPNLQGRKILLELETHAAAFGPLEAVVVGAIIGEGEIVLAGCELLVRRVGAGD